MRRALIGGGLTFLAGLAVLAVMLLSAVSPPPAPVGIGSDQQASCTVTTPASAPAGGLTADDVARYAYAAGFRGGDIQIAVAVARAESGWRPNATLLNTNGSTDHGLMQINSVHAAILAQGNWRDPGDNMVMAFKVWSQAGDSWRPWVTFKTGSYRQFLTAVDPKPVCKTIPITKATYTGGKYPNGQIPASALQALRTNPNHRLRADAADSFDKMSAAHQVAFGVGLCLTDSYRSLAVQKRLIIQKPGLAAIPGTSNHGWGVAVDLCAPGTQSSPKPWVRGSASDVWLHQNASRFGWLHPSWAEPNGSRPEPWHWQYGTDH